MRIGRFLAQLDKLEQELRQRPPVPLVGPPSLHASLIQGGTEINTYAAHCALKIDRCTRPGETERGATTKIQAIIDRLAAEDSTFNASIKPTLVRPPFEIKPDAQIVQVLEQAITRQMGTKPRHSG
jgi:acetylornithine deacetylase